MLLMVSRVTDWLRQAGEISDLQKLTIKMIFMRNFVMSSNGP